MREFFGFLLAGFGALGGWLISLVARHLAENVVSIKIGYYWHQYNGEWYRQYGYKAYSGHHFTPGSISLTIIIGFFILLGLGLVWGALYMIYLDEIGRKERIMAEAVQSAKSVGAIE